ncbi:sugar fermentation stimulation protein A [Mariniphaga anaerophila]|uniref:Sugar fermentation stimulation protein homolog n=1 Tax=Mariniphaga anaerophila TaxID=1484053 RepID=A0A1M4TKN6_9BACT|nr:DNA/RNA nuclease SfsA [Mariniphaga anaerophila]SHE44924.1 sugar fermentation stimulation protein A [Mariniphaga anaerophila]
MKFQEELVHGTLVKRYKRFLADVELDNGETVTAHCTNSGTMKSCLENGAEVFLSPATDPKRKTRFTWEMIKINGDWVGINTGNPNKLAFEAISEQTIPGLDNYSTVRREVKFEDSRFDVFAENDEEKCFVEVKNVTLKEGKYALFPDAVTTRGQKHLKTLMDVKKQGMRAAMLYIVQRTDVEIFAPAKEIDPNYAAALKEAVANGVEVFVMQAKVTPQNIELIKRLPVEIE